MRVKTAKVFLAVVHVCEHCRTGYSEKHKPIRKYGRSQAASEERRCLSTWISTPWNRVI